MLSLADTNMSEAVQEKTGLGNYFVANYPPFSAWRSDYLPAANSVMHAPPAAAAPVGLYLHIPFCRKRCKFCYFRVYTDKNARDVETYLKALTTEVELYSRLPIIGGRSLRFVYFGGGTPSYLSAQQLTGLMQRLQQTLPWTGAEEITFECEPGTLQQHKLAALRELGVTRLSLGIENFDDRILELNGRAHLSAEIFRAYQWARDLDFPQINIDLIAGMVGETWDNWKECVRKTLELAPDSVTIYQMELPFNTVFSRELSTAGRDQPLESTVADWPTKREWVSYAFDTMLDAGYSISSAYTVVKDHTRGRFVYRDSLWHGADMIGTGVASFGHLNGMHVQNVDMWEKYVAMLDGGEIPLGRALPVATAQLLIREFILQMKTGSVDIDYFQQKFGVDVSEHFGDVLTELEADGQMRRGEHAVEMTRTGLLQVDRLLPRFFEPEFQGKRYT